MIISKIMVAKLMRMENYHNQVEKYAMKSRNIAKKVLQSHLKSIATETLRTGNKEEIMLQNNGLTVGASRQISLSNKKKTKRPTNIWKLYRFVQILLASEQDI